MVQNTPGFGPGENGVPAPDKEARTWGMLCHLLGLAGFVFPFGNVIGPLVIWLIKKDQHPFIDDQGKEALNFQISVTIYAVIASILIAVVIGIPLLIGIAAASLVLVIIATVRSNGGEAYRYPLTIRLIK